MYPEGSRAYDRLASLGIFRGHVTVIGAYNSYNGAVLPCGPREVPVLRTYGLRWEMPFDTDSRTRSVNTAAACLWFVSFRFGL